jgi:hypothetical protein
LVISEGSPRKLTIGKNFGSGVFIFNSFPAPTILGGGAKHFETVSFSDLNFDGQEDIVLPSSIGNQVESFLTNDCEVVSTSSFPIQDFSTSIQSADLDQDGVNDIIVQTNKNLTLLLSSENFIGVEFAEPATPSNNTMFSIGKMNSDNFDDIAVVKSQTNIAVFLFDE